MTTVEAMACGTKVIVYKDTACEEIANTMGGKVVSTDVNALYAVLNEMKIGCKQMKGD